MCPTLNSPPPPQQRYHGPLLFSVLGGITMTSPWARWRLKSPASRLFTEPFFRHRSKKTLKFCVTGLCQGNSPVTGDFPAQWASSAENVYIWWYHGVNCIWLKLSYHDYCYIVNKISKPQIMRISSHLHPDASCKFGDRPYTWWYPTCDVN